MVDAREELARKMGQLARDIRVELENAGMDVSGMLPVGEIEVEETEDGVQVVFFASRPKTAVSKKKVDDAF